MPFPWIFKERVASQDIADVVPNSPECNWHRGSGYIATKAITLNSGVEETPQTYDLFTLTGSVSLRALYGVFTDVTNVTTVSACYFDADDTAVTAELTDSGGVDCSGATVNSEIFKAEKFAVAAVFHKADQVRIHEQAGNKQFQGALITACNATATTIRFICTEDVNTNAQITFYAEWVCRNPNAVSNLAPV